MIQRNPFWRAWSSPRWHFQLLRRLLHCSSSGDPSLKSPFPSYIVFSCDLELDPPWNTGSWESRTSYGLEKGLPVLVELLEAYHIRATFFSEGILAETRPEMIVALKKQGHEIGCHGYAHESYGGAYRLHWPAPSPRILTLSERRKKIIRAKAMLEETVNLPIRSFRAPYLHIDSETLAIVDDAGFLIDSSLLNTLYGKLSRPYHPLKKKIWMEGEPAKPHKIHTLVEIPITVNIRPRLLPHFPYLQIQAQSPEAAIKSIANIIALCNSLNTPAIILFVFHPWEFTYIQNPFGIATGTKRAEWVEKVIERLRSQPEIRFLTLFDAFQLLKT